MNVRISQDIKWKEVIDSLHAAPSSKRPTVAFRTWMKANSHSHNYDEVVVNVRGPHWIGSNGRAVHLLPGQILFLPRLETHDATYGPLHKSCVDFWMHFLPGNRVAMNFVIHHPDRDYEFLPVYPSDEELRRDVLRLGVLTAEAAHQTEAHTERYFYLAYFLAKFFRGIASNKKFFSAPAEKDLILGIKQYITRNLSESLTLRDLAKAAGYSPFHFHRMFVEAEGITPRRFVEIQRLEHAASLLQKGYSVTAAGYDSGFSGASQFSRAFRKHYGLPPNQWGAD
ncbi:MAG: helix-turn-helix domain-containing protein [Chthoniobacterales bacterium]